MTVAHHDSLRCTVVAVAGDLDKTSSPRLEETLKDLVALKYSRIIVDVTALDFCDSSGVWALLKGLRMTFEGGGWLRLAGVPKRLERLMRLTGIYEAFPVDASMIDSLKYASGRNI